MAEIIEMNFERMLPVCVPPYPDELFYSYVFRLVHANAYPSMHAFEERYMRGRKGCGVLWPVQAHFPAGIGPVYRQLRNNGTFPSLVSIFKMTPYIETGEEYTDDKRVESVLYDRRLVPAQTSGESILHWCPMCMEEDAKVSGEPYLHVSHHLGNHVCPRHGVPLFHRQMPGGRGRLPEDLFEGEPYEMSEGELADEVRKAEELLEKHRSSIDSLAEETCQDCGAVYPSTLYMRLTGAGCPCCGNRLTIRKQIQKRLDVRYPGEYEVVQGTGITDMDIRHIPCETIKRNGVLLLWSPEKECRECKALTVQTVQERVDPLGMRFDILSVYAYTKKNNKKKIRMRHRSCGKISEVFPNKFLKTPYCPYCNSRVNTVDLASRLPGYEIDTESMKNNHDWIRVKHKACGTIFLSTKTSLLAGRRCPVCVMKLDFDTVRYAVEECAPAYTVVKGKGRGTVTVLHGETVVWENASYKRVIEDLKAEKSFVFVMKVKQYREGLSLKRRILESVRRETERKGFWETADGIDGEKEYSLYHRNAVQKLTNRMVLRRIQTGRYIAGKEVFYDPCRSANR